MGTGMVATTPRRIAALMAGIMRERVNICLASDFWFDVSTMGPIELSS